MRFLNKEGRASILFMYVAALTSCQSEREQPRRCSSWRVANSPTNVFDIRRKTPSVDTNSPPQLTYAQRRILLHDAHRINRWLDANTTRNSSYVSAYLYAHCERLDRNPHAPCHVVVHADMEGLEGLFLVLTRPGKGYHSLYVAGVDGGASGQSGMFHEAPVTVGRLLSDSVVEVRTGSTFLAFRASGEQNSYTDTTVRRYQIDYPAATFTLVKSRTFRTPLARFFD